MKYTIIVASKISLSVEVEASSIEEAVEKAKAASVMSLCHQCSRGYDGEWSTSGELDCDPCDGDLVEVWVDEEEGKEEDNITERAAKLWEEK